MLSQQQPLKSPTSAPRELPFAGLCEKLNCSHEGGKPEPQRGGMATGPCEQLEQSEECPDFVKELLTQEEGIQNYLKEDNKKDAKIPAGQEEVNGSTNGIVKEPKNKLHVVEKDLDEFADSMSEATPSGLPKKSPEEEKHLLTEMAAAKLPRAEQVAEKVLRAERMVERAQRVEKPPVLEKAPVPRVEKAFQMEKAVRAEKATEKSHLAAPKIVSVKRKTESRAAKETLPWEGLTLNKCLLVATFLALLSVSCQVVQEVIEYGGAVLEAELSAWTTQESSPGEQEELWFYERWFDWSDMDEPPEIEEEELLEVEEELLEVEEDEKEDEAAPLENGEDGEEQTEPVETEEEDMEEEPAPKVGLRKIQEKIKRETPSKNKGRKDRKAQEEDKEKEHLQDRRPRWEEKGKEKQREERKAHRHKHSETAHPLKEHKEGPPSPDKRRGRSKDERGGKGKGQLEHERGPKDRKPWHIQRPLFSSPTDRAQRFGRHKSQEWKRHD